MPRPLTVKTTLNPNDLAKIAKRETNPRVRQRLLAIRMIVMANTVPQAAKVHCCDDIAKTYTKNQG